MGQGGTRALGVAVAILGCGPSTSANPASVDPSDSVATEPRAGLTSEPSRADTDTDAGPALTREEIRLVVRAKLPDIRACFAAGPAPSLRARVELSFTIGPDGKAREVVIVDAPTDASAAGSCLAERLPSWQFPRPRGGRSVAITYPFVFSSEESLRAAGLPRVEGTLAPEAVGAVFEARRAELDACIPDGAKGSLGVALSIDDAGAVTRISSYADSLPEPAGSCVLRTLSSWVFPPAASGDEARVNHDLEW